MSFNTPLSDLINLAFTPLRDFLQAPDVIEICINEPGIVFIERAQNSEVGPAGMSRYVIPELTADRIRFMSERVAAASHQFINEEEPLLSASLPDGARIQAVLPPAAQGGGAMVIRRQVARQLTLGEYATSGALHSTRITASTTGLTDDENALCEILAKGNVEVFLREAVKRRVSIMVSGGTGSGKTTFLNALMEEVPSHERLITIEDTPELKPSQLNHVRLIATRGNQNIARVDPRHLVEASLRMRPDRLLLGEIRGAEALDFLQAINTGHPGSLSTIHANSPQSAYTRLALLVMQNGAGGGLGLSKSEIVDTLRATLPLVVQLGRHNGRPGMLTEIFYDPFVRQGGVNVKSPELLHFQSQGVVALGRSL
ncbi:P-type DNA transfer ATPase VirB11 [Phyllobacterium sp. YR531]|uniref:P-type DNA transfer ATPase VirB11 n=1 Tax=Phyllobacterium sp. YR531 TaxID=1144343 RepID=UPI00026F642E|nr:P-type DNA transfer ATPase VirB11 [Phyllobacterium sp. YR531]EJN02771.1 P-type DNA transfer ATPase VirB11 [Phyllobacterium sp. YR531]